MRHEGLRQRPLGQHDRRRWQKSPLVGKGFPKSPFVSAKALSPSSSPSPPPSSCSTSAGPSSTHSTPESSKSQGLLGHRVHRGYEVRGSRDSSSLAPTITTKEKTLNLPTRSDTIKTSTRSNQLSSMSGARPSTMASHSNQRHTSGSFRHNVSRSPERFSSITQSRRDRRQHTSASSIFGDVNSYRYRREAPSSYQGLGDFGSTRRINPRPAIKKSSLEVEDESWGIKHKKSKNASKPNPRAVISLVSSDEEAEDEDEDSDMNISTPPVDTKEKHRSGFGQAKTGGPIRPRPLTSTTTHTSSSSASQDLRFCKTLLTELRKSYYHNLSARFLTPLDPSEYNIPDYFKIIEKPIDLSTIASKLGNGGYSNAAEFEADMRLIFKNCYDAFAQAEPVYWAGKELEELFEQEWAKKPVQSTESKRPMSTKHLAPSSSATKPKHGTKRKRPAITTKSSTTKLKPKTMRDAVQEYASLIRPKDPPRLSRRRLDGRVEVVIEPVGKEDVEMVAEGNGERDIWDEPDDDEEAIERNIQYSLDHDVGPGNDLGSMFGGGPARRSSEGLQSNKLTQRNSSTQNQNTNSSAQPRQDTSKRISSSSSGSSQEGRTTTNSPKRAQSSANTTPGSSPKDEELEEERAAKRRRFSGGVIPKFVISTRTAKTAPKAAEKENGSINRSETLRRVGQSVERRDATASSSSSTTAQNHEPTVLYVPSPPRSSLFPCPIISLTSPQHLRHPRLPNTLPHLRPPRNNPDPLAPPTHFLPDPLPHHNPHIPTHQLALPQPPHPDSLRNQHCLPLALQ